MSEKVDINALKNDKKGKLLAHEIAKMINHSLLIPQLTTSEVIEECRVAREYDVATVCVRPCDVALAKKEFLGNNSSKVEMYRSIGLDIWPFFTPLKYVGEQRYYKGEKADFGG